MNQAAFRRKLIYVAAIVVLLYPLIRLGLPATVNAQGERQAGSGLLSQLRHEYKLDQANLGEIDPAGETMKLATFGLRGVAAQLLWAKANRAKLTENWSGLQATLEQLAKLQPNYVSVWRFQAWNLSYNVSAEFDNFKGRYSWVKEGIKYLIRGARLNDHEHRLVSDIGWFTSQKIGRADERVLFRREFRADNDEVFPNHRLRSLADRDNWLVGKEFFRLAEEVVRKPGVVLGTVNPLVFYGQAPMAQVNYAANLEEDGTFDELAREHWGQAHTDLNKFGDIDFPSAIEIPARLNDLDARIAEREKLRAELLSLTAGLEEQIRADKTAALSAAEREALDLAPQDRVDQQIQLAQAAGYKIQVSDLDLAEHAAAEHKERAAELAARTTDLARMIGRLESDRDVVNYPYWLRRCELEQQDAALAARKLLYRANAAVQDADVVAARENFELGFVEWKKVLDAYPDMFKDSITGDEILVSVDAYAAVLKDIGDPFPKDFVLAELATILRPVVPNSAPDMKNFQPPMGLKIPKEMEEFLPEGFRQPIDINPPQLEMKTPDEEEGDEKKEERGGGGKN